MAKLVDTVDARFDAYLATIRRQKEKEVTTMTNLQRMRKELSPARRKKVTARAAQLIAEELEELTLQEFRGHKGYDREEWKKQWP
jgi:hypothetical protein